MVQLRLTRRAIEKELTDLAADLVPAAVWFYRFSLSALH